MKKILSLVLLSSVILSACNTNSQSKKDNNQTQVSQNETDSLPPPYATKSSTKNADVVGWPSGKMPVAPNGFKVEKYADNLNNPRWIYVGPNGDIFVSQSTTRGQNPNSILIFRDTNKDGKPDMQQVFASGLNKPFGMLILNDKFYIANTDGLLMYDYKAGQTKLEGRGKRIVVLPAGGYNNHWTRNIIASNDGKKILISVGSGSNVGENGMDKEIRRADILEVNPDGSGEKIYASGLRNPVGMDYIPGTDILWTAVNERDELGDDLVPDYITSVKREGFYGWPYSYYGQNEDPRMKGKAPELVKKAIVPDVPLGAHTASLGLTFYDGKTFPEKYQNGAFVGQHGSWNRSSFSGYKVVFVPFTNQKPGKPEDFLTGFIADESSDKVYGRPVCVTVLTDGSILVSDDAANTIWRVTATS